MYFSESFADQSASRVINTRRHASSGADFLSAKVDRSLEHARSPRTPRVRAARFESRPSTAARARTSSAERSSTPALPARAPGPLRNDRSRVVVDDTRPDGRPVRRGVPARLRRGVAPRARQKLARSSRSSARARRRAVLRRLAAAPARRARAPPPGSRRPFCANLVATVAAKAPPPAPAAAPTPFVAFCRANRRQPSRRCRRWRSSARRTTGGSRACAAWRLPRSTPLRCEDGQGGGAGGAIARRRRERGRGRSASEAGGEARARERGLRGRGRRVRRCAAHRREIGSKAAEPSAYKGVARALIGPEDSRRGGRACVDATGLATEQGASSVYGTVWATATPTSRSWGRREGTTTSASPWTEGGKQGWTRESARGRSRTVDRHIPKSSRAFANRDFSKTSEKKYPAAKSRGQQSRCDWPTRVDFRSEAEKTPTFFSLSRIRHPGSGGSGAAPRARGHNAPRRETAARDCFEAIERRYAIRRVISTRARVPRAAPDNRHDDWRIFFPTERASVAELSPPSDPAAGVAVPSIRSLTRFPYRFPRADRASL